MYLVEYRWIRKPMPVTISAIVPLSASAESETHSEVAPASRCSDRLIHCQPFQTSFTPSSPSPCWLSAMKVTTENRNDTKIVPQPIKVTASRPRRLPNRPFTSAPSSGKSTMNASSVKSSLGKSSCSACIQESLVTELIRLVAEHRLLQAVESQHDGQANRSLRGGDSDDEEGEDLSVHVADVTAIERNQGQIDRVEHELHAHQLHQHVAAHQK